MVSAHGRKLSGRGSNPYQDIDLRRAFCSTRDHSKHSSNEYTDCTLSEER